MPTFAEMHTRLEASHDFDWCAEAVESGQRPAAEQYENAYYADFFAYTLCQANRTKGEAIIRELMARLVEATEGMSPVEDEEAFCEWYAEHKMDPAVRSSANVGMGRACNYLCGHMEGKTDLPGALAVNNIINAWITAMNDVTVKADTPDVSEAQIDEELRQWLRDNVSLDEFTNHGEYE